MSQLQSVIEGHNETETFNELRDYSRDLLVMKVQLGQITEAVRSVVPESMWGAIIEKLEELEQHQEALSIGRDSFDDADDDPFDPTEFIDDDDDEF